METTTKTAPTTEELIAYVKREQLNIIEMPNADCTDVDQIEVDAETYVSENYEEVISFFTFKG